MPESIIHHQKTRSEYHRATTSPRLATPPSLPPSLFRPEKRTEYSTTSPASPRTHLKALLSVKVSQRHNPSNPSLQQGGKKQQEQETHLREIRRDDSAIREFPPRQRSQRLPRRRRRVELDVDLAHTGRLSASARGTGDLDLQHVAVLLAFFLDVFANFWQPQRRLVSKVNRRVPVPGA